MHAGRNRLLALLTTARCSTSNRDIIACVVTLLIIVMEGGDEITAWGCSRTNHGRQRVQEKVPGSHWLAVPLVDK